MKVMNLSGVTGDSISVVDNQKLIAHDDEAYLLHYYLQRGILPDYILSLDTLSRAFLAASMATAQEERRQFWGLGGDA